VTGSSGKLSLEDRILWNRVARSATPLRGKQQVLLTEADPSAARDRDGQSWQKSSPRVHHPPAKSTGSGGPRVLDRPTRNKLAKERLPIEARVDLHGLNQSEAHRLLLLFLHRAFAQGIRHVLVITGKGSSLGSEGVLRKAVPAWFATAPFRPLVGDYEQASRKHGGAGAFYVRLKRQSGGHGP
jgi:DNA-nicking Smr family endonuclease